MPTDAENLATIKSQTLVIMADLTANPKPSYNIDGQEVFWSEYMAQLRATIKWVDQQIATGTPYEIHSQGFT